jgi:hypothetical protein
MESKLKRARSSAGTMIVLTRASNAHAQGEVHGFHMCWVEHVWQRRTRSRGESMRKATTVLILSGVLATGAAGAVAITPASASTSTNAVTSRLAHIKSALSGLVSDGTLTQSQADKVASTLSSKRPRRGAGGPGARFGAMGMSQARTAAAKALGLTPANLQTALKSGKSLADIAKAQKVSVGSLVKAMVSATQGELATAVKNGTLTQVKADKIESSLTQRITSRVNRVRPPRGLGHGPLGAGRSSSTGDLSPMGGPMGNPSSTT